MEANETNNKLTLSIYNDVASPAMRQIGLSVEGLLKLVALPFKFLGLTSEQLEKKYSKFIEDAINRVPEQKLIAPKSSIVAPLLDYTKFCFTDEPGNDLLQDMFSKLLSSAVNQDFSSIIQKSFVEVMRFLSGNEARLLQWCSDEIEMHISNKRIIGLADFYEMGIITSFTAWDNGEKIFEIPATTPGIFPYLNFPVAESLDLLSSLGLIRIKRDFEIGYTFFNDLIELKKKEGANFEIPTLFNDAILKALNVHVSQKPNTHTDGFLSMLLQSETSQLYNMLSKYKDISTEQMVNLSITRTTVSITDYGHQFLNCCIE